MIRVILADDHHLVRQGIRALIDRCDDLKVVGEAENGYQAVKLVEQLVPDILVIDISMPGLSGIQAAEQIRALAVSTQVMILSVYGDQTLVRQALRNGARGYLLKSSVTEELLGAIRAASQGNTYLSPAISSIVVSDLLSAPREPDDTTLLEHLSPREREVLKLVAEGHTNNEIAAFLTVSVKTIEKHRASMMSKLGVHDVPGLVRAALKFGLIFLDVYL